MIAIIFQIVGGRLFTGSHDSTLRVWDITGITDDTIIGKDGNKVKGKNQNMEKPPLQAEMEAKPEGNGKILIDEDVNMNGHGQMNGNEYNNDYYNQNNQYYGV